MNETGELQRLTRKMTVGGTGTSAHAHTRAHPTRYCVALHCGPAQSRPQTLRRAANAAPRGETVALVSIGRSVHLPNTLVTSRLLPVVLRHTPENGEGNPDGVRDLRRQRIPRVRLVRRRQEVD